MTNIHILSIKYILFKTSNSIEVLHSEFSSHKNKTLGFVIWTAKN